MRKGLIGKLGAIVISLALVFTMMVPAAAYGATSTRPKAPKITSCIALDNTVTVKWSKVKGADFYKIYRKYFTKEWQYLKTVKKTSANKAKYSDIYKYKLKVSKSGNKYLVYKKVSVRHYKLLKKQTKRTYKFTGKYNKKYIFVVKAYKNNKGSKYSKQKTVWTQWDMARGEELTTELNGKLAGTTKKVRNASVELYKELAKKDINKGKNTLIGPVSFLTAMGMLENGAKGDTLEEIETAFGCDVGDFNKWFTTWNELAGLRGKTLRLANSVWCKDSENLTVNEKFKTKIKSKYKAQFYKVPFDSQTVKDVNNWVSHKTNEMIPKIVDSFSSDTVMALINATCFKGKWFEPFKEDLIKKETFTKEDGTKEKVDMMRSSEDTYLENDYVTGTIKYYQNGYNIMFLLPKKGTTVKAALNKLTGDDLNKLRLNSKERTVEFKVPKFEFDYTAPNSIKSLQDLGINKVFNPQLADLTGIATYTENGMTQNIFVSRIVHKTHIDLNEKGTDAAAATAIILEKASAYPGQEIKKVYLNRPFIFVIMDDATSTPVFMGTVQDIG